MIKYLFIDMNSYFASVEQQEQPELRNRPMAVVPVMSDTTCCIAASYEAKSYGVKTGTGVAEARILCPKIALTVARPKVYVDYHHRIIKAVDQHLPVARVCSIDEMYGELFRNERNREDATEIAKAIKNEIHKTCGNYIRSSIGIAPNSWLAKVATDLEKPDGLVVVEQDEIQQKISRLALDDLPGIGRGMKARLLARGITTIRELYELSEERCSTIWGSKILGAQWWYQLRGYDIPYKETTRRTFSHSHVLPPQYRNTRDAYGVMIRMIDKAAARMRKLGFSAERFSCRIRFIDRTSWKAEAKLRPTRDTITLVKTFDMLWRREEWSREDWNNRDWRKKPIKVSMVLSDLIPDSSVSLLLFEQEQRLSTLADTVDKINQRFSRHTVYVANMQGYNKAAPERISFTQIPDI